MVELRPFQREDWGVLLDLANQAVPFAPLENAELSEGEMCVVPRGIEHKPVAQDICQIMLVEPAGTLNTGDAGGERTITEENWI